MTEAEAEFGMPQLGASACATYAVESRRPHRLLAIEERDGWKLAALDTSARKLEAHRSPVLRHRQPCRPRTARRSFSAARDIADRRRRNWIWRRREYRTLKRDDATWSSTPATSPCAEAIEFPTDRRLDGPRLLSTRRATATTPRPPASSRRSSSSATAGPTGATSSALSLRIQFWTSRGIAVVDVNYGGSTGYGRAYRERLRGNWGIVDVDDCVNAARYLVERGDVDGERLAIRGGSAGGYTTLAALTFRDVFNAGASYYGVSDLEALAKDTHKFESRVSGRPGRPVPRARATSTGSARRSTTWTGFSAR